VLCLPLHALFVPGTAKAPVPEGPKNDVPPAPELRGILRG